MASSYMQMALLKEEVITNIYIYVVALGWALLMYF